ncbi:MAG: NAD(P)H-hydrate dehydratase [Candidatus Omnitrophota bacterium]
MRLPTPLLRKNPEAYKNLFGHVLVLAGSKRMLGASALCGLSAMRSGAGLTTLAVPESLNIALQKKISPVLMTLPLPETKELTFSTRAWNLLKKQIASYNAIAIGPGLTCAGSTQKFVHTVIRESEIPLIIDADALNAIAATREVLLSNQTPKILTPHAGEFKRLFGMQTAEGKVTPAERKRIVQGTAAEFHCVIVLKGHNTIVADDHDNIYVNKTGNAGMATAGSGDVLTGMISAFIAQGLPPFEAAKLGVYLHGMAGDIAAQSAGKTSLIATDIIENIPKALKKAKSAEHRAKSEKPKTKPEN